MSFHENKTDLEEKEGQGSNIKFQDIEKDIGSVN